jgi:hypothetical protein
MREGSNTVHLDLVTIDKAGNSALIV